MSYLLGLKKKGRTKKKKKEEKRRKKEGRGRRCHEAKWSMKSKYLGNTAGQVARSAILRDTVIVKAK